MWPKESPEKIHITHFYDLNKINLDHKLKETIKITSNQFDELSSISKKTCQGF